MNESFLFLQIDWLNWYAEICPTWPFLRWCFDWICDIGFKGIPTFCWNWGIFHMNRLLYCYDLSPDWPENIWKIKRVEIFFERISFEWRYNGDTQWKSEVETKILVLHFLHTGGADGGTTNLIFCAQQQRRWYLTWKTTTTTTTTATTTTATTTTKSL